MAETSADRRAELALEFPGVEILDAPERGLLEDSPDASPGAVLAVKPDVAEGACRVLGAVGVTRVLSIVAGIPSCGWRRRWAGSPSVVRAMPNTPALVGAGVTAISGGSHATSADLAWAEEVMARGGDGGPAARAPARSR